MSEMRLMEKFRLQKLTDFSYVWDTTYTTICNRASDDYTASVRSAATTDIVKADADYPTYHVTTTNFIVPRRYKYTTVLDGIVRGCVMVSMVIDGGPGAPYTAYTRLKIHLKAITSAGVTRTLASTGYSAVFSGTGAYQSPWGLTLAIPFLWDVDNAIIENDERLLISIDVETTGGSNPDGRSLTVTIHHAINTDESFFELPIVP